MFLGTYYHTIEEKGRVSLPHKFRQTSDEWIITRGLDGGLFLFQASVFEVELEKLNSKSLTKKAHRDLVRYMANEASEVKVDATGRILIPDFLRAAAQLVKDVVIVGSYQRIEIWDTQKYHQYRDLVESAAESIAESIDV